MYIISHGIIGYIKHYYGSKYLTLISGDEIRINLLGKCEEIWERTEYLIKAKNNNSYDCDK